MEKHLTSPWRHLTSDFFSNFYAVPWPSCIRSNPQQCKAIILIMHNDREDSFFGLRTVMKILIISQRDKDKLSIVSGFYLRPELGYCYAAEPLMTILLFSIYSLFFSF